MNNRYYHLYFLKNIFNEYFTGREAVFFFLSDRKKKIPLDKKFRAVIAIIYNTL
jgi:hypothetical protein